MFLCDVHISLKLVKAIESFGYKCVHTNSILQSWNTKDKDLIHYADENDLIFITKDKDFKDSFYILKTPKKLIKVNLGNIPNNELVTIFIALLPKIIQTANKNPCFIIEINKNISTITISD